jgi:hypothetical protein
MSLQCLCGVLAVVFLVPLATFAQVGSGLASKVEAVRFPPLARQARIQGDVKLRSGPAGITLVNGHPLLAPIALANLKELGRVSDAEIEAVYHFMLVNETETRVTRTVVKKGNPFTRLILRAFRVKTETVVEGTQCIEKPVQPNRVDLKHDSIEVWIYASIGCLQISVSQIASH